MFFLGRKSPARAERPRAVRAAPRVLELAELESRVLASAVPLPAEVVAEPLPEASAVAVEAPQDAPETTVDPAAPTAAHTPDVTDESSAEQVAAELAAEQTVRREIAFVDPSVADYATLIDDLLALRSPTYEVSVFLLDSQRNGVEEMTEILSWFQDVDAVHVLTHGTDSAVKLGGVWLREGNVTGYAGDIAGWQASLSDEADLLFYGCDLAASESGRTLVAALHELTGADVAASTDDTGHAALGGDWELEFTAGAIETPVAVSADAQEIWRGLLVTSTFQDGTGGYSGTQDTVIDSSATTTSGGTLLTLPADNTPVKQTLVRFDNLFGSGPGQIPYGSTITSATLTVNVVNGSVGSANVELHRMLAAWSEASTWSSLTGGVSLNDVEAASAADSALVTPNGTGLQDFAGLEATVQAWANGATNYGWVLTNDSGQEWSMSSSESATVALRPMLSVTYTPPAFVPVNETRVNTPTSGTQQTSQESRGAQQAIGTAYDGSYVVVWSSFGQDGSGWGVYGQRFNQQGITQGTEFRINQAVSGDQRDANVAVDGLGNFVVTWTSDGQDGSGLGVYARRFAADGTALGAEFRVNTTTNGDQDDAALAIDKATGEFVIVWEGRGGPDNDGIYFRRYNANGTALDATERLANGIDAGNEQNPTVAMQLGGAFVIGWEVTDDTSIHFQQFDGTGGYVNSRVQIDNGFSTSVGPAIATDDAGNFVVAYREQVLLPGVWMRGYRADGSNLFGWVQVAGGDAASPSLDMAGNGDFVVTFHKSGDGDLHGVCARVYDATGTAAGAAFLVNQTTTGDQHMPSVALLDTSNFVVAWSGNGPGDSSGVFVRQFGTEVSNTLTVDTLTDVLDGDTSSVAALLANKGADGFISLREAIVATNNTAGADTIVLPTGTITLTSPATGGTNEADAAQSDLDITGSLTIVGAGMNASIVDGSGLDRVFHVLGATATNVTFTDFTVANGNPGGTDLGGGAYLKDTNATLTRMRFTGNASGYGGGGFTSEGGTLVLTDSWIDNNTSTRYGGGLQIAGGSVATLNRVTISGNSAGNQGGGIYLFSGTSLSLTNVTLSGNSATLDGGAMFLGKNTTLTNVTIANNTAGSGGGIYLDTGNAFTVTVTNSIFASNTGGNSTGALTSGGHNIDVDGTALLTGTGDVSGIDPLLGVLQDNGGYAPTHALAAASIAIDAALAASAPLVDQRGQSRDATPDVGAFEYIPPPNSPPVAVDDTYGVVVDTSFTLAGPGVLSNDTDVDPDTLTAMLDSGPTNGTLSLAADGSFVYTPDAGFLGVDSFTYFAHDGTIASPTAATVTIYVYDNTLIVDTTSDLADGDVSSIWALQADRGADGYISLREAILATNATPNAASSPDRIHFDIAAPPVAEAHTIDLLSALPDITDAVVIDGLSDPHAGYLPAIELNGSAAGLGVNGLVLAASDSTITGLVVNRFSGHGIVVAGNDNWIEWNFIGTSVDGRTDLGNGGDGLFITGANNLIGSDGSWTGNVIGGNAGTGVRLSGAGATGNVVAGNYLGLGYDGLTALGNDTVGVWLDGGAANNRIGGTSSSEGNRIVHNLGDGVRITGVSTTGNALLSNLIYANGSHGIDLADDGVTANDTNDADTGPNDLQNFPVLTSASYANGELTVSGTFNSLGNTTYRLEFFETGSPDAGGHGEALSLLGFTTVTTNGSGVASFNVVLNGVSLAAGDSITATATRVLGAGSFGSTSEFAQNLTPTIVSTAGVRISSLTPTALGGEFRVNTTTAGDQWNYYWSTRTVAVAADGSFVKVWIDTAGADGSQYGVYGQRFDANGSSLGGQFLVNTTTGNKQTNPSLAMAADGSFLVAWDGPGDGSGTGVFGQMFRADGSRRGGEFQFNTFTSGTQQYPEVDFAADGSFVAAWVSNQSGGGDKTVFRRFDAAGNPVSGEVLLSTGSSADQVLDSLEVRADGSFLVSWTESGDVYGRLYDAAMNPVGVAFQLNQFTTGTQKYAIARSDAAGNFVAVWASDDQDGSGSGMVGRRFAADGTPLGNEFTITSQTAGDQFEPQLAMDAHGQFVVAWTDANAVDGSAESVWLQRFDPTGQRVGSLVRVNETTVGYQGYPVLAMNDSGRLVVAWEGNGPGDSYGIFARRYQLDSAVTEGATGTFSVVLTAAPTSDVVVDFSTGDASELTLVTTSLTFDTTNWNVPQTVTFVTAQDFAIDGAQLAAVVTANAQSSDAQYDNLAVDDAPVLVLDSGRLPLVVDTTADVADGDTSSIDALIANRGADGRVSLREAILAANATANAGAADRIDFALAGASVQTITLVSALPTITDAVYLDGYSQSGSVLNTATTGTNAVLRVRLDGSALSGDGLVFDGSGSSVAGLVLSNFGGSAIVLRGGGSHQVGGNFIGSDAAGLVANGNGGGGVRVESDYNQIGSETIAFRNLIGGNGGAGIVFVSGATNNVVEGNLIGVNKTGAASLGNGGAGVELLAGQNTIGGVLPGEGNVIAFNGVGVLFTGSGIGVTIRGNEIFENADLGIDLGGSGYTLNDAGDIDSGPNGRLNFPDLSSVVLNAGATDITGTYNGRASTTFLLDFYSSPTDDPSGYGEGRTYLGTTTITTDGSGNASFTWSYGLALPLGTVISATATATTGAEAGSTSEFGEVRFVTNANSPPTGLSLSNTAVAENTNTASGHVVGTLTTADPDASETFAYAIVGGPDGAMFSIGGVANDQLVLTDGVLDYETKPLYQVVVRVTDSAGHTLDQSFSITVTNVNESPVAANDSYVAMQDSTLTIGAPGVLSNDSDPESGSLTAAVVTGPANGSVTLNADGSFVYTPNAGYFGTDTFTYRASDGTNVSGTATVTLTVLSSTERLVNFPSSETQETSLESRGSHRAVDSAADGSFVVVWSATNPMFGWGVYGRRYDASGNAVGGEFVVNQTLSDDQHWATVSLADDGRFVVAWTAENQDGSGRGTYARLYNADGTAATGEFRVNVTTSGDQYNPSVTMLPTGEFIVAWEGSGPGDADGIFFRRYDATGTAVTGDVRANSVTADRQSDVVVASNAVGQFVIAWDDPLGFHLQRYDSTGTALGGPITVDNSFSAGDGSVAIDDAGRIVAVWRETVNGRDVLAQRYDAAGNAVGTQFAVNLTTTNDQTNPSIDMDGAGNFLVTWEGEGPGGETYGVFGRKFTAGGVPLTGEFRINATTAGVQSMASVSLSTLHDYVAVWTGNGPGDTNGVFVRSFVNNAPTAANDGYTIAEDGTLAVTATSSGVLANDTDANGDLLAAVLVSGVSNGSLTLNPNGTFVYTPTANFFGTDTFVYRATDLAADSNLATVTITVTPVNDPPVAANDGFGTTEDTPLTIGGAGVLANDTDLDGPLTASLVAGPANGTLTLNADGSFVYTPNAHFAGNDSFTYRAYDGTAFSGTATVSLAVSAVNDAPVASDDSFTTAEDTPLLIFTPGLLSNDSDVDSAVLLANVVTSPANGSLSLNANGSFVYTPNANFAGTDRFTYRASDGVDDSNVATVTITVTSSNDAPVAAHDGFSLTEDVPLSIGGPGVLSNDTDIDGNTLTASLVSGPANGTLTLNADGSFDYTPNAHFAGTDTFTYRASDGTTDSNTATVTLTVAAVNDPPVAVGDSYTTAEDTPLSIGGSGVLSNDTDIEGNLLTATLVAGPTNGVLTLNPDGSFTYVPNANSAGTDSFVYRVSDGTTNSNPATVTLTVAAVNDPPAAVGDSYTTGEDTPLTIGGSGVLSNDSDVDGGPLSATLVSGPANGTVTLNGDGSFTYVPNANFAGSDTFIYRASDGAATSNLATATITVTAANDPPVAADDSYTTAEDTPLSIGGSGVLSNDTDIEGNTLTATLVAGPTNGALTLNPDGSFVYVPNANFVGTDTFVYRAFDGTTNSNPATVTLTVNAVNDPPAAVGDSYTTAEDTPLTIGGSGVLSNDTDIEGNSLAATLVAGPTNGALTLNPDGSFTYVPNANFTGIDTFIYRASDGAATSNLATVTITVTAANDPPVAADDSYVTAEDSSLAIGSSGVLGNDADADGDALTAVLLVGPVQGTLTWNGDGSFVYVPDADVAGTEVLVYHVSDGTALSNAATVTITVVGSNDAPTPSDDAFTAFPAASGNVLANDTDADGEPLTASLVQGPSHGSLVLNSDGSFSYVPNTGFVGVDAFVYAVQDASGTVSQATVSLTVIGLPAPPTTSEPSAPSSDSESPPAESDEAEVPPPEPSPATDASAASSESSDDDEPKKGGLLASTATEAETTNSQGPLAVGNSDGSQHVAAAQRSANRASIPGALRLALSGTSVIDVTQPFDLPSLDPQWLTSAQTIRDLDAVRDAVRDALHGEQFVAGTALMATTGLSVGYVVWIVRGGYLLASVLSTMPAWRFMDPLPVLDYLDEDEDDDESLEEIADREVE